MKYTQDDINRLLDKNNSNVISRRDLLRTGVAVSATFLWPLVESPYVLGATPQSDSSNKNGTSDTRKKSGTIPPFCDIRYSCGPTQGYNIACGLCADALFFFGYQEEGGVGLSLFISNLLQFGLVVAKADFKKVAQNIQNAVSGANSRNIADDAISQHCGTGAGNAQQQRTVIVAQYIRKMMEAYGKTITYVDSIKFAKIVIYGYPEKQSCSN